LELLHDARDHAHRDVAQEELPPELGRPELLLLLRAHPGGLQPGGEGGQRDRQRDEEEEVDGGDAELPARQGLRRQSQFHVVLLPSPWSERPLAPRSSPHNSGIRGPLVNAFTFTSNYDVLLFASGRGVPCDVNPSASPGAGGRPGSGRHQAAAAPPHAGGRRDHPPAAPTPVSSFGLRPPCGRPPSASGTCRSTPDPPPDTRTHVSSFGLRPPCGRPPSSSGRCRSPRSPRPSPARPHRRTAGRPPRPARTPARTPPCAPPAAARRSWPASPAPSSP